MKRIIGIILCCITSMSFASSCPDRVQVRLEQTLKNKSVDLRLAHLGIDDLCTIELSFWLKKHPGIDRLDLSSNAINDAGIQALMKTMLDDKAIRSLILDDNYFSRSGIAAIAAMLSTNRYLKRLDLGGNHLHAKDMQDFSDALIANRSLEWLYLNENNLGQAMVAQLLKTLETNKTLKYLHLGHNGVNSGQKTLWKVTYDKKDTEVIF